MKQRLIIACSFAVLFFACKKQDQNNLKAFYKGETQCAERWQPNGNYEPGTPAHSSTITQFLSDSLGVTATDLTVIKENDEAVCLACQCTNGYVIRFKADESHTQVLLDAGFSEQ